MMLTGPDDSNRLDRLCVALAFGAAIHCVVALPLRLILPWLSGEAAHQLFALAVVAVSVPATVRGWLAHHSTRVFPWAFPGWLALALARFGGERELGEVGEVLLTVAAAALLFVAHRLNRSLAYWHDRS